MSILASALAVASPAYSAPEDPAIPFEKLELANGLTVLLSPDASVPFVWVDVWYDVGSKDETPGRSGFAHLFEHLMFQGSSHADEDYFQPLQRIGAQVNGNTTLDRTNYFEGVPAHQLPLALFLESDRMGWLDDALTEAKLQNQKDVVRNERRQRYENPPYGEMWPKLLESVWPEGHPYHIATIGKHEDLEAASLSDAKTFFNTWYLPNNATLVVAGDFDPAETKRLVQTYFGDVPAGPEPVHATVQPVTLQGTRIVKVEKAVPFPRVQMAWITPPGLAPGDAELDLVSTVLTSGKDAPLYKALVRDQQLAQEVSARQGSNRLGSMFVIDATAASGHTADELVAAIDTVLAGLRTRGLTAEEIDVARTEYEVSFWGSLGTISAKAVQLAQYNATTGDPGYLAQDLARYRNATVASVNEAFKRYVPADQRVILQFAPPTAVALPSTPVEAK